MSDNNDFVSFFAGMVIGGLIGAAAALLLAPASGEETRAAIRDKSIELKDKATEYGQDFQLRAEKALESTRMQLADTVDDLRKRTEDLSKLISKEQANIAAVEELKPDAPPPAEA
jgi:gas vesicle protein